MGEYTYFKPEYINRFRPSLFWLLKMKLLGAKRHVSYAGFVKCVAYEYKGIFYITKMDAF